jgi:hypothetical protein
MLMGMVASATIPRNTLNAHGVAVVTAVSVLSGSAGSTLFDGSAVACVVIV